MPFPSQSSLYTNVRILSLCNQNSQDALISTKATFTQKSFRERQKQKEKEAFLHFSNFLE
jgi:hypothetical protein